MSLSSWRAWIEMSRCAVSSRMPLGRSPHGERGLKYFRLATHGAVEVALLMESVD